MNSNRTFIKKVLLAIIYCLVFVPFSYSQTSKINNGVPGACGAGNPLLKSNPNPSPMDGSGSMGQSFNQSACGLNYVAATHIVETRYDPYTVAGNYGCPLPCAWSINGMSPCIAPVKALVWANVSYTEGSPPLGTITITNPLGNTQSYSASAIGTSVSKCWGETGTAVYRWDVTPSIGGNGSYTFNFSGFSNPLFEIDGATIFIIYRDLNATYDGSLIFWDGAMAQNTGGTVSQTMTGFNVCATPSTATAFMITSDHQDNIAASHNSMMNGVTYSFPNSFSNFQVQPTNLVAGQTTSAFNDQGTGGDCSLWGMAGLYYQSSCTGCTPTGLAGTQSSTPAGCSVNNGTATVNPSGGILPYTYVWSPAVAGNTNTANNLAPGSYNVTIYDATGCSTPVTIVVGGAAGPAVTATSTQAGCTVANGSATANPSGGSPGYNYAWSPSGGNAQTANNLSAGTYVVTVTDANGCTAQTSVVVAGTNAPTVTATTTQSGCTVANGSATANPSGGTPNYNYAWSPSGGNAQTANNLSAGNYVVTVTDANGCTAQANVTITTANGPTTTASAVANINCNGGNTGSATATPSGGTPNYTYAWSPSGGNAQTANNLTAGNYTVTVTDANGCTATSSVTLTQPPAITTTAIHTNVLCNGGNTGSATVTPSGGTPGYNYMWSPSGGNAQTANNLTAGNYSVTVTDANGCTKVTAITITQPQALSTSINATNVLCNGGNTGSATATVSNGTAPYNYAWTPIGGNAQTANNLPAGNYTVTVTDANGCKKVTPVTITQPPQITLSVSGNDSICAGDHTTLNAVSSGGTPAYTYVWNPGPQNGTSVSVNPTASTSYTVVMTDANGCTSLSQTFNVLVLPAPNALFDTASSGTYSSLYSFSDLSTPSVTITAWDWNFGDNTPNSTQQNPVHTFPGAGTYTVTEIVFNKFGCPDTFTTVITINEGILIPNVFTPDGDGVNDVWYIPNSGMKEFHVDIYDRWGLKVFETTADEIRWDGHSTSGKLLTDGTYYFVLKAYLKSGANEKNYSKNGYVTLLTNKK